VEEGYKILVHLDFFFLSVGALVNEDEKKNKKVQTRAHVGANRSLFILLIGATSHKK